MSFFLVLLSLVLFSLPLQAISSKIPRVQTIPSKAKLVATGSGWSVYLIETEYTDLYTASVLYLKNKESNLCYRLLETKGKTQKGTHISIKARLKQAYGHIDAGYKEEASYEYGYIECVEEVYVLSSDKILVSGVPDARNYYNYVIDLNNYTAIHYSAFGPFIRIDNFGGVNYLEFSDVEYTSEGRIDVNAWYDFEGNFIKSR